MPKNRPIADREAEREEHGVGLDDGLDVLDRHDRAQHDAAGRAEHATDPGEQRGLDEELREDVAVTGADRLADADLTGALGDGHQHDVHHADAADEQRDRGDRSRAAR